MLRSPGGPIASRGVGREAFRIVAAGNQNIQCASRVSHALFPMWVDVHVLIQSLFNAVKKRFVSAGVVLIRARVHPHRCRTIKAKIRPQGHNQSGVPGCVLLFIEAS